MDYKYQPTNQDDRRWIVLLYIPTLLPNTSNNYNYNNYNDNNNEAERWTIDGYHRINFEETTTTTNFNFLHQWRENTERARWQLIWLR